MRFAHAPLNQADTRTYGIGVWLCGIHDSDERTARFEASLSAGERERASRFRHAEDRLRFVTGRGLARELVGAALDTDPSLVPIVTDASGRPVVRTAQGAEPIAFSVSHSGAWVLVALSREGEVGVDVERERTDLPLLDLAETTFASGERAALESLPHEEIPAAFYALWTRREAFTKALGHGLKVPAESVEVSAELSRVPRVLRLPAGHGGAAEWRLYDLCLPDGYHGARAARGSRAGDSPARAWRLSP